MSKLPKLYPYSYLGQVEPKDVVKWTLKKHISRNIQHFTINKNASRLQHYKKILPQIKKEASKLKNLDNKNLQQKIQSLQIKLRREYPPSTNTIAYAIALIREITGRELGMYHFDSQILGGLAILYGNIAEMQTGEGKTLTAILPAAFSALMGVPTYILSVNDYLTARDAEQTRLVYQALGLSVGCVTRELNHEQKKQAYGSDIIYCTASELVFDYLKDQTIFLGKIHYLKSYSEYLSNNDSQYHMRLIRGLHFAIIDEIDSILLDEALTPLILSGNAVHDNVQESVYEEALMVAKTLIENEDFIIYPKEKRIELSITGTNKIHDTELLQWGGLNHSKRGIALIKKSLFALYLLNEDHDYLVQDDKIQIVDIHTGRLMADRNWERGLHQFVELKENCPLTSPHETLAQITFQKFFQKFGHLAGMSGTVIEAKKELGIIYQLPIVVIPPNKKSKRDYHGIKIFSNKKDKYSEIVKKSKQLIKNKRAVLIGTSSIQESEILHDYFEQAGIIHDVLNAKQNEDEAKIISNAGQVATITIATSMAGRGTDIKLSKTCELQGGLHVIVSEFHNNKRIDRQLTGRAARQGDKGSFEYLFSKEDLILKYGGKISQSLIMGLNFKNLNFLSSKIVFTIVRITQRLLEKKNRQIRYQLLKSTPYQEMLLSLGRKKN